MDSFNLDIVVPVFDEADNIVRLVNSLTAHVRTPFRLLVCYDRDDDTSLPALERLDGPLPPIVLVKNEGQGVLGAIRTGLAKTTAMVVLTMPADDDYNAPRIDAMVARFDDGVDIVCPSRFVGDGCMVGCPIVKATLVRLTAWFMHHVLGVPTHDATTGFRFFSRRVIERIPIESKAGFAYSMELLVKCHRLGWRIEESPALWFERVTGASRFSIVKWAPIYLEWVFYAMSTRFLGRGPETVVLREPRADLPERNPEG